jgi:hypothetical protein
MNCGGIFFPVFVTPKGEDDNALLSSFFLNWTGSQLQKRTEKPDLEAEKIW